MLVFALGITPEQTLHDMIASHEDAKTAKHDRSGAYWEKAVFHCQCDNLVVESAFVAGQITHELLTAEYFSNHTQTSVCKPYATDLVALSLRGPPAC